MRHAAFLLAWLLLSAAPAAAQNPGCGCLCPGEGPLATDPTIDVQIERIDTARYPDVDVFFRVVDTNATTDFHEITLPDVKLEDGPAGGATAPVEIVSNNFPTPELRPLAGAVVLDRSSSVEDVLGFITRAINEYVREMKNGDQNTYRPTNPERKLPDVTHAVGLAGNRSLRQTRFQPFTDNINALQSWVTANLMDTQGGSPIFGALDSALTQTDKQTYEIPDASRLIFLISDGKNNRGYAPPGPDTRRPEFAIANARAARIRVYTLAMSKVDPDGIVIGDICRNYMKLIARDTGGVYFEPRSPFPVIPAAPTPPEGVAMTDTNFSAAEKLEYLQLGLGTCANLAKSQNKDVTFPDASVNSDLGAVLAEVSTNVTPTWKPFVDAWTANPLPTPTSLDTISYADLLLLQNAMVGLGETEVTDLELKKQDYYHDQVKNILTKVQKSEKNVYRATYRLAEGTFDGSPRQIKVTVQYTSAVNGVVTALNPASAVAGYRAASVLNEDRPELVAFPLGSTPGAADVFRPQNPRGGPWGGTASIRLTTRLMAEIPASGGSPPTRVPVALLDPDGTFAMIRPSPSVSNFAAIQAHLGQDNDEYYRALLTSLNPNAAVSPAQAVLTLTPRVPTCVRNPAGAGLRPLPNASEGDRARLMWFEVNAEVSRPYSYDTFNPLGGNEIVDTSSRFSLPTMTYYVADNTPPTIGVYLTPAGSSTSMVAVRPENTDRTTHVSKVQLLGAALGLPGSPDTLVNGFVDPPYDLDGGGSTPGFAVPQNVAVRIQVIGRDNSDRNHNLEYLLPSATPKKPACDVYDLETQLGAAARDNAPPYLARLIYDGVGAPLAGAFASGISYRFEEAGQSSDVLADTKIFRAANVTADGDTFTVNSGQDIILAVNAADASGNRTVVRIPILVTPMGVNIGKLTYESKRSR